MVLTSPEVAARHAMEMAKVLCANPQNGISINAAGANRLADFIETLEDRFTGKTQSDPDDR